MKPEDYPDRPASQAPRGVPGSIRIFMSAPPPADDEESRFSSLRVFRHRFRGGIAARLVIDLQKLRNREENYVRCEWSGGRPTKRIVAEYRRWSLSVWRRISDETGQKIMEALQTKPRRWEMWVFRPNEAPKKIREVAL